MNKITQRKIDRILQDHYNEGVSRSKTRSLLKTLLLNQPEEIKKMVDAAVDKILFEADDMMASPVTNR